jgi:thiol-disulfide isomerase/thioredoxin
MRSVLHQGILWASALGIALALGGCASHAQQNAPQALSVGSLAPNSSYALSDGRTISSSDLAGHPYMLWIMATWCSSCQGGTQVMAQHIAELRTRGVRVLQLEAAGDLGYAGPPISAFQAAVGAAGRSRNWLWGTATMQQMHALDPNGYPDIYYLVNADGTIAAINGAPAATWSEIEKFSDSVHRQRSS